MAKRQGDRFFAHPEGNPYCRCQVVVTNESIYRETGNKLEPGVTYILLAEDGRKVGTFSTSPLLERKRHVICDPETLVLSPPPTPPMESSS